MTTKCSQLKMTAADGKRYLTDCLAQKDTLALVEIIPSRNATQFIKWLTWSNLKKVFLNRPEQYFV